MLTYHPAFDLYHCIFRHLCLLEKIQNKQCESNKLRILDFYFLFPGLVSKIAMPKNINNPFKKNNTKNCFAEIGDPYRLFSQLEELQTNSFGYLLSVQLIHNDMFKDGIIKRTKFELPDKLKDCINNLSESENTLITFITGPLFDMEFYGEKGLKERTGLIEYRYDKK
jgi:hypothetical protein